MRGFFCIASIAFGLPPPGATAKTASELFEQVSPSVVVVPAYDAGGNATKQGSGVVLPGGNVTTHCHVLKGSQLNGSQKCRVQYKN